MTRPLAYRLIRRSLKAASQAANGVMDRAMQRRPGNVGEAPVARGRSVRRPVVVDFGSARGEVERGITLLDAAQRLDVDLSSYCGGNCSCGTCRVEIVAGERNLSNCQGMERQALGPHAARAGNRLACQTRVLGPVTVRIPAFF